MIRQVVTLLKLGLVALCVATLAAQGLGVAWLWFSGRLPGDKVFRLVAVLHDIDLAALERQLRDELQPADDEQPSHQRVVAARVAESLDLDLRETAVDKAVADFRRLQDRLAKDQERYEQMKASFDARLAELERGATDEGILALQRSIESMQPRQAKEQLLRILDEPTPMGVGNSQADDSMLAVVTVIKALPNDKQKKLFAEFRTDEEQQRLAEILRKVRLGEPESDLFGQTRNQLQQFTPQQLR